MLNTIKKFLNWIRGLFVSDKAEEPVADTDSNKEVPLYLACNGVYIARIENLERQIEQTKIDFAIGSISEETYNTHFEEFQRQVKQLSADYARELLLYSA